MSTYPTITPADLTLWARARFSCFVAVAFSSTYNPVAAASISSSDLRVPTALAGTMTMPQADHCEAAIASLLDIALDRSDAHKPVSSTTSSSIEAHCYYRMSRLTSRTKDLLLSLPIYRLCARSGRRPRKFFPYRTGLHWSAFEGLPLNVSRSKKRGQSFPLPHKPATRVSLSVASSSDLAPFLLRRSTPT